MNHPKPGVLSLLVVLLAGCVSPQADPPAETDRTEVAVTSTEVSTTATTAPEIQTIPIVPHSTVDASTMTQKLMMGYQGWFTCPGDGSSMNGYYHWIRDGFTAIDVDSFRGDMWPDTTELTDAERCSTNLSYPDGSPAYLYSAANYNTVLRHFQWMSEYEIDGVFLQRFGSQLIYRDSLEQRNKLTQDMAEAAESYGRTWAIMYDVTGTDERDVDLVETFAEDWKYLVDALKVTENSSYLHHNGRPVLAVWGLGFEGNPGTADEAMQLADFFRNNPDPRYQVTLMGGVPFLWRTLEPNAQPDPLWAEYYCSLDVISPWTVGAYASDGDVDFWLPTMLDDMTRAQECGADFMPVVYPGHSYHNPDPSRPFNEIPRRGGDLYWHQVATAVGAGASMIYNAMFDEVDESTAMYKIAATASDVPVGLDVVAMDTDGDCLPSDWYLRLAGEATRMLSGEIQFTETIPITPASPSNC
jgi:hypothetical protein